MSLAKLIFKKEKTQIINIKHERRGYHYKFHGHKRIIEEYYKELCAHIFNNQDEIKILNNILKGTICQNLYKKKYAI